MSQALASAGVAHYHERLAELSTLPFWQLPDFGEPSGPERGHVWHRQDIYPELARSRDIADDAARPAASCADLQQPPGSPRRRPAHPTIAAACQMLFHGETAPVYAYSMSALRFGLTGEGARMSRKCPFAGR